MLPKQVFVVYCTRNDEILSVHSLGAYATLARRDRINDDIAQQKNKFMSADDLAVLQMHYVVATLEDALQWMKSPITE